MSDPFIAEIRIFAGNFAPRGWAFCDGQLLPIAQNTALFSLVGTVYGGDGRTTFGVPNLQDRVPMHPGRGPGLSSRRLGEGGGVRNVTLTPQQLPPHTHPMTASLQPADDDDPSAAAVLARAEAPIYASTAGATLAPEASTSQGGGQAHNNLQPYLALHFIIALVGTFPSRS